MTEAKPDPLKEFERVSCEAAAQLIIDLLSQKGFPSIGEHKHKLMEIAELGRKP